MNSLLNLQKADGSVDTQQAMVVLKAEASMTVEKAWSSENRIATLKRQNEKTVFDALNNMIAATNLSLNVQSKTTSYQALEIIYLILNDYANLTLEDVLLCFKRGKSGMYGPTYNRLDFEIISWWLHSYTTSEEYLGFLESAGRRRKAEIDAIPYSDQALEWVAKIKKSVNDAIKEEKPQTPKPIDSKMSEEKWKENMEKHLPEFTEQMLEEFLHKYRINGHQLGINLIENEQRRRKNTTK